MATLTVYQNNKTSNFSLFQNYANAEKFEFQTAQEWFDFYHQRNCTSSEYPRCLRIKRYDGQQWGDDGANSRYTLRMAQNDFKKFAK